MSDRTDPTVVRIDDDHPDFDPDLETIDSSSGPDRGSDKPTNYYRSDDSSGWYSDPIYDDYFNLRHLRG